ncbi:sigma-70 family RNA polymerase sigma factor [Demequina sp.]|uniref:sigma-70 family RNA polymerase sigma factor n=1 Tax=Demequina sp. TaxID=2050685 RepID=UPI003D12AE5E
MSEWEAVACSLMEQRYRALVGYARMVAGPDSAEDLVQDALVKTFSRPRGLANVTVAEAYVRRAIVTGFLDSARKTKRAPRANADALHALATDSHADAVTNATTLEAALSALTARERVCVALRYLEGLSVADTARTLGLAEGSVKRYVADGIAKLNRLLGTDAVVDETDYVQVVKGGSR